MLLALVDSKLQSRIINLYKAFHEGKIPTLSEHEVNPGLDPGSRENYLYFTLPVSINFQRSSPAMWAAALKTWQDPETNYVFYPERVVKVSFAELQADLVKHKLALQKNKHVQIWQKLAQTLFEYFQSDPRFIFKQTQNCVVRTKNLVQLTQKKDFPYLSGAKMANYWLYILDKYTDIKLRNKHKISIIPDTHVLQSTLKLGLSKALPSPLEAEKLWLDILKNTDITQVDMHPVLWNWSRNNFSPEV